MSSNALTRYIVGVIVSFAAMLCLAACGATPPPPTLAPTATAVGTPAVTDAARPPTTTAVAVAETPTTIPSPAASARPTATALPVTPAVPITPDALSSPQKNELRYTLQTADGELRAAQASGTLAEARTHAEGALNASVGTAGRWYGDSDHDGQVEDPANGMGILPGELVPAPGGGPGTPVPTLGLAFLALDNGNAADRAALGILLGDVELWRSTPRQGYDAIDAAAQSANAQKSIAALGGNVPRAVAAARYILVKAQTLDEAKSFAGLGSAQTGVALGALR